ncbi:MAG: hypothetical protein KC421_26435, partial [Anaerolineales bacterium]|nr:hypothetical protein [Anaerolineales bacterium]
MKRKLFLLFIVLLLGITTIASAQSSAPFGIQVVRLPAAILLDDVEVGTAEFWNTRNHFMVDMALGDDWLLQDVQVYLGDEPTATDFIAFMYNPSCYYALPEPDANLLMQCDLKEELDFTWGQDAIRYVSIRANAIKLDDNGVITDHERVWVAYEPTLQPMIIRRFVGWYFSTNVVHPRRGHFIDSPVAGLTYETPTNWG